MSVWQSAMIWLACNRTITNVVQKNAFMKGLSRRFVGGTNLQEVLAKAAELKPGGFTTSLYYLGEYVEAPERIEENVSEILKLIAASHDTDLDVLISVDPTQVGYTRTDELGQANMQRIAEATRGRGPTGSHRCLLMLDMEDFSYVARTVALRARLAQDGFPVGITIQAYLRRSEQDIQALIASGVTAVRLVKGAFAENRERAWTKRADITENYFRLASLLLAPESRAKGVYPIFATHDDTLIDRIMPEAQKNGWAKDDFEFEMLYGVRTPLQQHIAASGHRIRLYVPYGTAWWPYSIRRVGENPANVRFVFRALRQS